MIESISSDAISAAPPVAPRAATDAATVTMPATVAAMPADRVSRAHPLAPDLYDTAAKLGLNTHAQGSAAITSAASLIAAHTDERTGKVDTTALAGVVADAARTNFAKASTAFADIKNELQQRNSGAAQRFESAVTQAFTRGAADSLAGTSAGLSAAGKSILVHNPILSIAWESTTSAWTGKGGFTPGLLDLLDRHGIDVPTYVNAPPAGSLGKSSGVAVERANNMNGSLARDAIAKRYAVNPNATVNTEVARPNAARRVDVTVDVKARDPRNSLRIEVESKVGRVSQSPKIAQQAAKDGAALAENASVRGAGEVLAKAGKVMLPVAVIADGVQLGEAFHADGNTIGVNTGRAASGIAGGWGGAIAGAEAGAALGSFIPGAGTVVGGVIGGIVGGIAGDSIGRSAFNAVESLF